MDCWFTCAVGVPEETARITPRVSARAIGMSSGAAARAVRRLRARRVCARRFALSAAIAEAALDQRHPGYPRS